MTTDWKEAELAADAIETDQLVSSILAPENIEALRKWEAE